MHILFMDFAYRKDEYLDFHLTFEFEEDNYDVQVTGEIKENGIIHEFKFNRDFIIKNGKEINLDKYDSIFIEELVMEHFRSLFN